jgi:hypothetical protein
MSKKPTVNIVASRLDRAAYAFKMMKKAEKEYESAKREYFRLARLVLNSKTIYNNSVPLTTREHGALKITTKGIQNAGRVRRTLKNLPNNMQQEVFQKIKEQHVRNIRTL